MTVGLRIATLREENKITQIELAEMLDVSRQTISKWECDICLPETSRLIHLAKIFNVTTDYILLQNENLNDINESKSNNKAVASKFIKNYKVSIILCIFLLLSIVSSIIIYYGKRLYIVTNGEAGDYMNYFQATISGLSVELTLSTILCVIILLITIISCIIQFQKNK